MDHRFSLRFESGERRGETIPISGSGLTVGRKPGNTLQILDNSVSGQHAEIRIDGEGAQLKDLGSTNGTRVGTQRVIETRLKSGDTVLFGNIRLTFVDANAPAGASDEVAIEGLEAPVSPSASVGAAGAAADGLERVSADVLARSKKRSFVGLAAVVVLAVGAAGAYFALGGDEGDGAAAVRAVEAVPGNLLSDGYSFEDDRDTWTAPEGAPAAFLKSGLARRSGSLGLAADVDASAWARSRSTELRPTTGRQLVARGFLRAKGAVEGRLGIEFSAPTSADATSPAPVFAWSEPAPSEATFVELTVRAAPPAGYSIARVVVDGRARGADGSGSIHADDISAIDESSSEKTGLALAEATFQLLGARGESAVLTRVDRVLLSGLAVVPAGADEHAIGASLSARVDGSAIGVQAEGEGDVLRLCAEAPLARVRIATTGEGGYKTHGPAFERTGVDGVLLGSGIDVVRLRFAEPVSVKGIADGAASHIAIRGSAARSFLVQLDFSAERKSAGNLAHEARGAERKGDLGLTLAKWGELLDAYPFEEGLVNEAETTRARLIQAGLEELRTVSGEIERARFFQLADLSRQCREKALAVGARYRESEVEVEAKRVADLVAQDLAAFGTARATAERGRLRSILAALEAQKQPGLAGELRTYLDAKLDP